MDDTNHDVLSRLCGSYAVVIPGDPAQDVRVVELPDDDDAVARLRDQVGGTAPVLLMRRVGRLWFWYDQDGARRPDRAPNVRAAWQEWCATPDAGQRVPLAGTVVITVADPTGAGVIQGLSASMAHRIARNARTPLLDVEVFASVADEATTSRPSVVDPRSPEQIEVDAAWGVAGCVRPTVVERGGGLRVGVLCDTRTAMSGFAERTASLTWVLLCAAHQAARRADPVSGVECSAVTAAVQTKPDVLPCLRLDGVDAAHRITPIGPRQSRRLDDGVVSLRQRLWLATPDACRLIVLITDARAPRTILDRTRILLTGLRDTGCGVLWLCPASAACLGTTFPGTTLIIDPDDHLQPGVLGEAINAEIQCPPPEPYHPDDNDAEQDPDDDGADGDGADGDGADGDGAGGDGAARDGDSRAAQVERSGTDVGPAGRATRAPRGL